MKIKRIVLSLVVLLSLLATVAPRQAYAAGKPVSDDFLSDTIRQKLAADQIVKGGAIEVQVKDGAVVLTGKVEEEKQKTKAEKITRKVSGVKSVDNKITLSRP